MTPIPTDCLMTPFINTTSTPFGRVEDDDVPMTVRVDTNLKISPKHCPVIEKQSAEEMDVMMLPLNETMDHHGECLSDGTLNGMRPCDSPSIFCGPPFPDSECLSISEHTDHRKLLLIFTGISLCDFNHFTDESNMKSIDGRTQTIDQIDESYAISIESRESCFLRIGEPQHDRFDGMFIDHCLCTLHEVDHTVNAMNGRSNDHCVHCIV